VEVANLAKAKGKSRSELQPDNGVVNLDEVVFRFPDGTTRTYEKVEWNPVMLVELFEMLAMSGGWPDESLADQGA
jgi:hypothetical protein